MIRKPTVARIKAYRDKRGCSLQEAKAVLMKQWRTESLTVLLTQAKLFNSTVAVAGLIEYLLALESEQ